MLKFAAMVRSTIFFLFCINALAAQVVIRLGDSKITPVDVERLFTNLGGTGFILTRDIKTSDYVVYIPGVHVEQALRLSLKPEEEGDKFWLVEMVNNSGPAGGLSSEGSLPDPLQPVRTDFRLPFHLFWLNDILTIAYPLPQIALDTRRPLIGVEQAVRLYLQGKLISYRQSIFYLADHAGQPTKSVIYNLVDAVPLRLLTPIRTAADVSDTMAAGQHLFFRDKNFFKLNVGSILQQLPPLSKDDEAQSGTTHFSMVTTHGQEISFKAFPVPSKVLGIDLLPLMGPDQVAEALQKCYQIYHHADVFYVIIPRY
ncbi:MAG: hypothetical protein V4534_07975 [Myxococcota bacterium]